MSTNEIDPALVETLSHLAWEASQQSAYTRWQDTESDDGQPPVVGWEDRTEEQREDTRAGVRSILRGLRRRALFPATEPAEDGWGDVNPNDPKGRTYRETAEEYYSAPAVPAEEETKAEALTTLLEGVLEYDSADMGWHLPGDWDPTDLADAIVHAPASSPVVPAPNETGPWQTWEAVPDGVKYHGIGGGGGVVYVNYGGQRFRAESGVLSLNTDRSVQMTAPFVAAEEGQ
ncbi:hypothetical protein R4P64_07830 [Rhodococcus sp. IEGM 1366]|uniref:hypothetical protein n=1 Tax=Rhodococcus sp. IEGM 1366 TaxID=3082223 RepID=UPI0029537869|nr:hypothetical protein [Rhodococcus sp. IEGM 1366]MDV8066410.1 hypothetical protein [Rhodococcus sp. IEGM 1366]